MKNRDVYLDDIRGCAMIWVMFVHSLYWTGLFSSFPISVIKSITLIEMLVFFFVIGAGTQMTTYKSYGTYVGKRLQRILIPYWIYAVSCVLFLLVYRMGIMHEQYGMMEIIRCLFSWLIPIDRQQLGISCLTWALWFVPVYCMCTILIPLLLWLKRGDIYSLFGITLLFAVFACRGMYYAQMTMFYLIWIFCGMFYPEIRQTYRMQKKKLMSCGLFISVAAAICMVLIHKVGGITLNMQSNKFPPNLMFLAYSVCGMSALMCLSSYIIKIVEKIKKNTFLRRIFEEYSMHSMTIFLFHPFLFMIMIYIIHNYLYMLPEIVQLIIYFSIAVYGGSLISRMLYRIEKIEVIKF